MLFRPFVLAVVSWLSVACFGQQTFDVTFSVDMSEYSGEQFGSVDLNGYFNGWCGSCVPLYDDDGDGVYTFTVQLEAGIQEYKFTLDGWNDQEIFVEGEQECTTTTDGYTNRYVEVFGDIVLPTVCWNSCSACSNDYGCTVPSACNYNEDALEDDGSCEFTSCISGCTDPDACNYSPTYLIDDGSCEALSCSGCMDVEACNYDPLATLPDESCAELDACGVCGGAGEVFECGCTDIPEGDCNCDGEMLDLCGVCGGDNSTCTGCTYEAACNYDPEAIVLDIEMCEFGNCLGCTDPGAVNFNPFAVVDDGTCNYQLGCTDMSAINFNPLADSDDGSCVSEGVFFQVDMSAYPLAPGDVVNVAGSFNGWCGDCTPLSDLGDGWWGVPIALDEGEYEYVYVLNNWEASESYNAPNMLVAGSPCDYNPDDEFPNRGFLFEGGALILDAHCFGVCGPCESAEVVGCMDPGACNFNPVATVHDDSGCDYNCADLPTVQVLFQVDMSQHPGAFQSVHLNGSFNGWCGDCMPLEDSDADGIFEVEVPLELGVIEYKFTLDGWSVQEEFSQGDGCTTTIDGYTNRSLVITDAIELPAVCWNSCESCVQAEIVGCLDNSACNFDAAATVAGSCVFAEDGQICFGCTNPTADNYDALALEDDGSCVISGCTNPEAVNYDPAASNDDGSCVVSGCTDPNAINFNPTATNEDGSCLSCQEFSVTLNDQFNDGWTYFGLTNYLTLHGGGLDTTITLAGNLNTNIFQFCADLSDCIQLTYTPEDSYFGENSWVVEVAGEQVLAGSGTPTTSVTAFGDACVFGCLDTEACNYIPEANVDDGSCLFYDGCGECGGTNESCSGCTDATAVNYDATATIDDGSCYSTGQICVQVEVEGPYTGEMSWNLIASNGAMVFEEAQAAGEHDLCLTGGECYIIAMYDSYGDGWNGGTYSITMTETGYSVASGSLDDAEAVINGCAGCITNGAALGYDSFSLGEVEGPCGGEFGCLDSGACNFDEAASIDDGSCDFDCTGCTDPDACNFDATATMDDGSCLESDNMVASANQIRFVLSPDTYAGEDNRFEITFEDSSGEVLYDIDVPSGSVGATFEWDFTLALGCYTFTLFDSYGDGLDAIHFNPGNVNGWLSLLSLGGSSGDVELLSWEYGENEWFSELSVSFVVNECSNDINGNGICDEDELPGCTDPVACNYDPTANTNYNCSYSDTDGDGICDGDEIYGCQDVNACNFSPEATEDDGSCLDPALYDVENCECHDLDLNGVCDFEDTLGCTNPTACNFNENATSEDGSCVFSDNQDCEGACMIAPAEGPACLDVLDFICHRNTVVASTGDIYQGHPDDIPSFFAIDSDDSLQTWGLAPLWTDWPEGQIWNVPPDATVSQLFEGMYGQVFAVDEEGNLLNQGDIGVFGMVLPALGNVVAADANEFGAVFLLSNGTVVSIGSEGMPDWNPQVPFAVALSNTIDVASVYEVHLALSDEGEIGVWGTFWNYDYYFAIPDDYLGTAVDLDGGTAAALLRTDLGEVRVWGNQQEWATQVNTFDWLANPAVHAKVDDNGVVALHEDGSMSAFSDSTSSWVDYATLLPPPSFGPVVDFDISPTGLIAKNASGQLFTKFVESHGSLTDWVNNGYDTYLSYSPFIPDVNYTHAFCVPGCTDDVAINFWPSATQDDGSCVFGGCTDDTACNFDSSAVEDDGSCTYPEIGFDCSGTCADADSDGVCDLDEVDGCVWTGACNFNPAATEDDGSCMWPAEGEDCEGACLWSSVASGECESFAGLSCDPGKLAVGPSISCGEGSRLYGLGSEGLTFAGWHNTNLEASLVAADSNWQHVVRLGTEPLSGQLHGITDEGDIVAEPSCFGVDIPSIGEAKKLDLEGNHGVMLRQDGIVISFAPADAYDALESTPIIFNYQVEDVACGFDFNVAVDGTQNVLYWGVPHPEIQYGYLDLPYAGQFTNIDAFGLTAAGLTTLGEVLVWGEDAGGVVSEAPAAYQEAVQVVLGDGFAVMLRHDGTVEQWGQGAGSAQGMPMPPTGLSNVVELASSANQVAAYLSDGSVVHWGVTPSQAEVAGLTYASAGSLQIATEFCIPGCTNPDFVNFDISATTDDGSCANAGCTDALALNFAPWADTEDGSCLLFGCSDAQSCSYNPEANFALRIDTVAVHQGVVGGADLTGYVTYRLYLETPGEEDILIFMGGQDSDPMSITTTTSFFQDPLSVAIPSLPAAWLNFVPSLAYDSWVTIGVTNETYNDGEPISTIASPEQDWEYVFEAGGDLVANDWVGGGWFGWPTHSNSVVGSDGEILVAQLTTDGDLNVESLFGQVWLDGDPDKATSFLFQADLHGCAYPESDFADCAGCLNDGDGDGICDEDETGGCTDQTACNFDAYATEDDGTCSYSSSDVSVVVETVANHSSGMLAGYSTYRVYAELSQPTDKVDAIYGSMSSELVVSQGEALMWQHPNMGPGVMHVSDEQLLLDPTMAFDSYVALGAGHEVPGAEVEVIGEGWTGFFEQGFPIQISDQAGGGWYLVDNGQVPNAAGEDYRVLLGQFTTQGGLSGVLNLQVEGCGGLGTFNAEGLNFSSNSTLLGCMDEEACNFSPVANTDDGNCCYDHCFQAEAVGEVEIESGVDGSILVLVPTEGQVHACLPWGCYVVRGATGVSWNGLEAQGELYGDGQLFEVGTSECLGCTQSLACNYAPLAMFDDAGCDLVVADFNGDQFVAIDDMLMLLSEFGNCTSTTCIADIDGDSDVGVNDLLLLLSAFGTGC